MVRMLAFYSDDLSSNPAEAYNFSVNWVFGKNENKQKEAGIGPLKIKTGDNILKKQNCKDGSLRQLGN